MHEHGLAKELFPQLRQIAENCGFRRVTQVDMIVGTLHGVSADFLAHSFEHAFEGAVVNVTIVEPGEDFIPPNSTEPTTAHGWELLISRIEGEE